MASQVLEFKEFEKAFNAARRENTQERQFAEGTLSPTMIERALRQKTGIDVPGEKHGKGYYTFEELQAFRAMIKRVQGDTGGRKLRGAPIKQILGMSTKDDIDRANDQIKYSRLYQVRGGLLKFSVPASGESGFNGNYQVRIRLEDWDAAMVSGKAWPNAAKQAVSGRISIDCQCGRHQYWYRYLAGVGGFAVEPPQEKDFPKIRNPSLDGAACKHVIKTLQTLLSPTTQRVLASELERQADAVGYNKVASRYLTNAEHETLKRARPKATDSASAAQAYRDYLSSIKAMKPAAKKAKTKVEAEQENAVLRAKNKLVNQRLSQQQAENRRLAILAEYNKARADAIIKAVTTGGDPLAAGDEAKNAFVTRYSAENNIPAADILKVIN